MTFGGLSINSKDITEGESLAQQSRESNGLDKQGEFTDQSDTIQTKDVTI